MAGEIKAYEFDVHYFAKIRYKVKSTSEDGAIAQVTKLAEQAGIIPNRFIAIGEPQPIPRMASRANRRNKW